MGWKDQLLNALLAIEASAVILFVLPYTNLGKSRVISSIASNATLEMLREYGGYEGIFISLCVWYRSEMFQSRRFMRDSDMERVKRLERMKFAILLLLFLKRSHDRISGSDIELLKLSDQRAEERAFLEFKPPSKTTIKLITRAYRACFDPIIFGQENIPKAYSVPTLYVFNHTILGFEYPVLLSWLYEKHNVFLRVLADRSHFQVPLNAKLLRNYLGAVDGTRRNVDLLMARKEAVAVYPGGARETFKRTTDDKYQLFWEGKNGFAAMAIKWGAVIVPVANVGTEDMVSVLSDLPLGWLPVPFVYGTDRTLPIISFNALERIYFHFGEPIPTAQYGGDFNNEHYVEEVKTKAQASIEKSIALMRERRKLDYPDEIPSDPQFPEKPTAAANLAKYIRSLVGARL
jgi:1-acyl-sn-glycerol-3-phosphate acyltransferase